MVRVRLWERGAREPVTVEMGAVPPEGALLRTPWATAVRVAQVKWDVQPGRDPELIVDVHT